LEDNSPFQVVVIVGDHSGKTMDGIPIIDYGSIPAQIQYQGISIVFIADESLGADKREEIRRSAKGVPVRDYLEYLSELPGKMPVSALLGLVEGPVTVTVDGADREFSNLQECVAVLSDRYEVKRMHGAKIEVRPIRTA